jgi:hypothetical protein
MTKKIVSVLSKTKIGKIDTNSNHNSRLIRNILLKLQIIQKFNLERHSILQPLQTGPAINRMS